MTSGHTTQQNCSAKAKHGFQRSPHKVFGHLHKTYQSHEYGGNVEQATRQLNINQISGKCFKRGIIFQRHLMSFEMDITDGCQLQCTSSNKETNLKKLQKW